MAEKIADLVKETTESEGTGNIVLGGAADGFFSFFDRIGDQNQCRYCITDGVDAEVGLGTVHGGDPPTLSRDSVEASTNGDSLVDWGAGEKDVYNVASASLLSAFATEFWVSDNFNDYEHPNTVQCDAITETQEHGDEKHTEDYALASNVGSMADRDLTVSTDDPSGGENGDVWYVVED